MGSTHTLKEISSAIGADHKFGANLEIKIAELCTDSRRVVFPEQSLFFALRTGRSDGHQFVPIAYKKGIRAFVVEDDFITPASMPAATFLVVKSSLNALQDLGQWKRSLFKAPVIAVSGSNGKTIVKEWIYQVLHDKFTIVRSPKSYNSQIGVPLSLWQITSSYNLGIFEAGISKPGEMSQLAKMIQPNIGVFTNILDAHDENFQSRRQKCLEKLTLFRNVQKLVFCADDPLIKECVDQVNFSPEVLFPWSAKASALIELKSYVVHEKTATLKLAYQGRAVNVDLPFTDPANLENAMHCVATALALGVDLLDLPDRFKQIRSVSMRLNLEEGVNNCDLINDYYNADFDGLKNALEFLESQRQKTNTTVILSDIVHSEQNKEELYHQVARLLKEKKIDHLIAVGPDFEKHSPLFSSNSSFFNNTKLLLEALPALRLTNETILIKGARSFAFEKVAQLLKKKTHQTVLEVNLTAIQHNYNFFRSQLKPSTKTMVMVKALSYGAGTHEIAKLLAFNNAAYLGVAFLDEGIALRDAGITTPIMVMNPDFNALETMISAQLEPEVFNQRSLDLVLHFLQTSSSLVRPLKIHLKVDTGMHRLGFDADEVDTVLTSLEKYKQIEIASVFSHLATSDDPAMDEYTKQQIKCFTAVKEKVIKILPHKPPLFHILNSAGITRFPKAQFDMVRIGIGLYGVSPDPSAQKRLLNCSTLKTKISQIKSIDSGDAVGYGRAFIAQRPMEVATLPIGYADGFNRSLSCGKGAVLINGKIAPIVGNVCMDMTMVDVSGIDATEGQEAIIFGSKFPLLDYAKRLNTIPYEALTSISPRIPRVFYQE